MKFCLFTFVLICNSLQIFAQSNTIALKIDGVAKQYTITSAIDNIAEIRIKAVDGKSKIEFNIPIDRRNTYVMYATGKINNAISNLMLTHNKKNYYSFCQDNRISDFDLKQNVDNCFYQNNLQFFDEETLRVKGVLNAKVTTVDLSETINITDLVYDSKLVLVGKPKFPFKYGDGKKTN